MKNEKNEGRDKRKIIKIISVITLVILIFILFLLFMKDYSKEKHIHKYNKNVKTKVTCTGNGIDEYICKCGDTYEQNIAATGHEYKSKVLEATCTDNGYTLYTCIKCNDQYKENVTDKLEHKYKIKEIKEATCEEEGYKKYECECGDTYTNNIKILKHSSIKVGKNKIHTKCKKCNKVLISRHNFTVKTTKKATCTKTGIKKYECNCGYNYEKIIKKTNHEYIKKIKIATCKKNGYTINVCNKCGNTYNTNKINALGHINIYAGLNNIHSKCDICNEILSEKHNFAGKVTKKPTCTKTGVKTYICLCGYNYTEEIAYTDHNYKKTIVKPTCTSKGYTINTCSKCKDTYNDNEVDPLGHIEINGGNKDIHTKCKICNEILSSKHDFTENIIEKNTCTTDGIKKYSCKCGYNYIKEMVSTGHNYKKTIIEPTCINKGYTINKCSKCDDTYNDDEVDFTGHAEINGGTEEIHTKCNVCDKILSTKHDFTKKVIEEVSCTANGLNEYTCKCGYYYKEEIISTGHDYEKTIIKPTCIEKGYTIYICSKCGDTYKDNEVDFTGHTEINGGTKEIHTKCNVCDKILSTKHDFTDEITKEATCDENGTITYTCNCGYKYEEDIKKLEHDFKTEILKEATTLEDGEIRHYCTKCTEEYFEEYYSPKVKITYTYADNVEKNYNG